MKKSQRTNAVLFILFSVSVTVIIVFSLPNLEICSDQTVNSLLIATVPRLVLGVFLTYTLFVLDGIEYLKPVSKALPQSLFWCIPCFLVALANFPFSALINGTATVARADLIWLFTLKCLSIGLIEEMFFRGMLLSVLLKRYEKNEYGTLITVIFSSAFFGLFHLINLFFGASAGATALQVSYSFLIGCMLAVTLLRTKNIWLCVLIHALFDFGGSIVLDLGSGAFQDMRFWIFTVIAGIICTVHILFSLRKMQIKAE